MAVISSHVLDSVKGISACGIRVELFRLSDGTSPVRVFDARTDSEGRISESVDPDGDPEGSIYELIFHTGSYFPLAALAADSKQNMETIVVRITMPDPDARYHIPVVLSPHSYTVWWSG